MRITRTHVNWTAVAIITIIAIVPASQSAYHYASLLRSTFHPHVLASPSLYAWAAFTLLAILTPTGMLLRMLTYLQIDDAEPRHLARVLSLYVIAGFVLSLVWQVLAWGCFPIENQYVRFFPFDPWPERPFVYGFWTALGR